jgi:peptidoglycan/xylan/chitin deacetylase (PgdA/CDA1 family)
MSPALSVIRVCSGAASPSGRRARLSTLIFHRVYPQPDPLFPGEVDAHRFDLTLGWLKQLFNVMPLGEAVDRLKAGTLPARPACITFDDGYADNESVALPLLRKHGLHATFFVSSGYLDGGRMWNDTLIEAVRQAPGSQLDLSHMDLGVHPISTPQEKRAAIDALIGAHKYLPPAKRQHSVDAVAEHAGGNLPRDLMMTSAQVRALSAAGMTVGAHTVTHPILSSLDAERARSEIAQAREALQAITGDSIDLFAYPNGKPEKDYLPAHVEMVKALGFRAAVSTAHGTARFGDDVFELPRFTPWDRTPARFGLRLLRNSVGAL